MVVLEYGSISSVSKALQNESSGTAVQGAMHFPLADSQWSPDRAIHGITEFYFNSSNDNKKKNKLAKSFLESSVAVRLCQCAFDTFFKVRKARKAICL